MLSKYKQNLINEFINPFYADYKEAGELSLNEKDLQIIFKKQHSMQELIKGTPKYQLRKLFQTRRQEQKIQDVLKKASVSTLRKLKEGVELFDMFFLLFFVEGFYNKLSTHIRIYMNKNFDNYKDRIDKIYFDQIDNFKFDFNSLSNLTRFLFRNKSTYNQTQIRTLETILDNLLVDLFSLPTRANPNTGTLNKKHYDSFKKMFYKLQLYYKKQYRPAFLNEWLGKYTFRLEILERSEREYFEYVSDIFDPLKSLFENIFVAPFGPLINYLNEVVRYNISSRNINYNQLFDRILTYLKRKERKYQIKDGKAVTSQINDSSALTVGNFISYDQQQQRQRRENIGRRLNQQLRQRIRNRQRQQQPQHLEQPRRLLQNRKRQQEAKQQQGQKQQRRKQVQQQENSDLARQIQQYNIFTP
jgi:hypothetical protein